MTEPTTTPEPADPAMLADGVVGLLATAVESTIAGLGPDEFAALVARCRPPDEAPPQPQGDRPPPRMPQPQVPTEPTEQQQRDHELYGDSGYPATWGFQRSEESK